MGDPISGPTSQFSSFQEISKNKENSSTSASSEEMLILAAKSSKIKLGFCNTDLTIIPAHRTNIPTSEKIFTENENGDVFTKKVRKELDIKSKKSFKNEVRFYEKVESTILNESKKDLKLLQKELKEIKEKFKLQNKKIDEELTSLERKNLFNEGLTVGHKIWEIEEKIKHFNVESYKESLGVNSGSEVMKTNLKQLKKVLSEKNENKILLDKRIDAISPYSNYEENKDLYDEANFVWLEIFKIQKNIKLLNNEIFKLTVVDGNIEEIKTNIYSLKNILSEKNSNLEFNIDKIQKKSHMTDTSILEMNNLSEQSCALKKELHELEVKEKIISKISNKQENIVKLSPGELLVERPSHCKQICGTDHLKLQYYHNLASQSEIPNKDQTVFYNESKSQFSAVGKIARFDQVFKQAAKVLKVIGNQDKEVLIDLREVHEESNGEIKYYVPFKIEESDGKLAINSGAGGWLVLSSSGGEGIHICRIDNFMKSLNSFRIGSTLIQFAIEKSIEAGFGGQVTLVSSGGSGVFYHKLGFVCESLENQKKVEQALRKNQRTDGNTMYLHEEAIIAWRIKIDENPIFLNRPKAL